MPTSLRNFSENPDGTVYLMPSSSILRIVAAFRVAVVAGRPPASKSPHRCRPCRLPRKDEVRQKLARNDAVYLEFSLSDVNV